MSQSPVPCPKCRRLISADSYTCSHCGAPVAYIWEDCRQACYFLRLGAVFLLGALVIAIVVIVAMGVLDQTGLTAGHLAIISLITAASAIGLWKFSDAFSAPPAPWELHQKADQSDSSSDGSVGSSRKEG